MLSSCPAAGDPLPNTTLPLSPRRASIARRCARAPLAHCQAHDAPEVACIRQVDALGRHLQHTPALSMPATAFIQPRKHAAPAPALHVCAFHAWVQRWSAQAAGSDSPALPLSAPPTWKLPRASS